MTTAIWVPHDLESADLAGADQQTIDRLFEAVAQREDTIELLVERFAELELALEDEGWIRLGIQGEREFTREGLARIIAISRLMFLKNPLIRRGVNVKTYYTWAQGVQIKARDQMVNEIVHRFLDDPGNRDELFSHQARMLKDAGLQVDANVFLTLFPNKVTGHVKVRSMPVDEVPDIICNPEDARERWFYRRRWVETQWVSGVKTPTPREALYPDWRYRPAQQYPTFAGTEVRWKSPVMHLRVGGLDGMRFGVPETYSALDWARAYKSFLEDWASIVKSLQRFAYKVTTTKKKLAESKRKLSTTLSVDSQETNPQSLPGSDFIGVEGANIEAIPKSGATVESEDSKPLRLMVGSAMDLPDTMLSGDLDQGNLATAKAMDRPTELAMVSRQQYWGDVLRDLASFAIRSSVVATQGRLKGSVTVDEDGIETITVAGKDTNGDGVDLTVDVIWPPILEHDLGTTVDAIVAAATLDGKSPAGTIDDTTLVRLLLTTIGVDDVDDLVDDIVEEMERARAEQPTPPPGPTHEPETDEDGNPIPPSPEDRVAQAKEALTEALREFRTTRAA